MILWRGCWPHRSSRRSRRNGGRLNCSSQSVTDDSRTSLGNHYYALTVSSTGGRVMVRDWMEGQFEALAESIGAWFSDLSIVSHSGRTPGTRPASGDGHHLFAAPAKIEAVRRLDQAGHHSAGPTVGCCATTGGTYPIRGRGPRRTGTPDFGQTGELEEALDAGRDTGLVISRLHTRMGLLKAYHVRKYKGESQMTQGLNETHPSPAYQCGRLVALLARLQKEALGPVGAGVIQRFYAAASTTPALVLARLIRTSNFHLGKLRPDKASEYERRIANVYDCIRDRVPSVLSLEEQSSVRSWLLSPDRLRKLYGEK